MRILFSALIIAASISNATGQTVDCFTIEEKIRIQDLTSAAIDEAFQAHIIKLFSIWLKDYSPEPKQAMAGMKNGISAYMRAHANAERWDPTICKQ